MILYVNGDSNSAGAEAVNTFAFAEDDPLYWALGRRPHPDNERVSWGCNIANELGAILYCDAESASSNQRIYRTTKQYLDQHGHPDLVIIGWSTWERVEWWHKETQRYWQINAGGVGDDWPEEFKDAYREYITELDYHKAIRNTEEQIWTLHLDLQTHGIPHMFFNCWEPLHNVDQRDWNQCYLEPYNREFTYYNWLKNQGFGTVTPESYHFGADAHRAWADFLYPRIVQSCLTR